MKQALLTILFLVTVPPGYAQLRMPKPQVITDTFIKKYTFHIFGVAKPPRIASIGSMLPNDYYTRNFGFFCRKELQMHKAGLPVSFRLGSMDDCNRLEQKGH